MVIDSVGNKHFFPPTIPMNSCINVWCIESTDQLVESLYQKYHSSDLYKCSYLCIHLSMEEFSFSFTDIICIIDRELFHHKNENARFLVNGKTNEHEWTLE